MPSYTVPSRTHLCHLLYQRHKGGGGGGRRSNPPLSVLSESEPRNQIRTVLNLTLLLPHHIMCLSHQVDCFLLSEKLFGVCTCI